MPSRSYVQSPLHLLSYYVWVVVRKLLRVVGILTLSALLCLACTTVVFGWQRFTGHLDVTLLDVIDWLFRYRSDNKATAIYALMRPRDQLFWHGIGVTFQAVVTGFVLEAIIAPVGIVRFARYVVLDTEQKAMRIRYWVRLPEARYLANASVDVLFEFGNSRHDGSSSKIVRFRFVDPQDQGGGVSEYFGIRGVRTTDIPFEVRSPHSPHGGGCTLWEALVSLREPSAKGESASIVRVRIKGQTPAGANVMYERCYRAHEILFGYKFLTIRRDYIENFYRSNRERLTLEPPRYDDLPKDVLFLEHFIVVVRIVHGVDDAPYAPGAQWLKTLYGGNEPRKDLEETPGNHVPRWFRVKVFLNDAKSVVAKVWSRIGRRR